MKYLASHLRKPLEKSLLPASGALWLGKKINSQAW